MPSQQNALFEYGGRRFYARDVLQAVRETGVHDSVDAFVHSDLRHFGKIAGVKNAKDYVQAFIDVLFEAVGPGGTLIMPTFTYSFCNNQQYDPLETPSTVGLMTEQFRKLPGAQRSGDALFSVAASGSKQGYYADVGTDCFGAKSAFEKLYDQDALLVFLGPTFDITFMHFVEQRLGVPYRYKKRFEGAVKVGGRLERKSFDYYVRDLGADEHYDLEGIAAFLEGRGVLKKAPLGHSFVRAVGARAAFDAMASGLRENPRILLKEKPIATK